MQQGRDYDGTFLPGEVAAKIGAKGGATKTKATKKRGFGAHPELAKQMAARSVEARRLKREQSTG